MMASFGGETQAESLPACLRNKNLYLGFVLNATIVGVKIDDRLEFVGNEKSPGIIHNPVILGEWNIHTDDGLPVAMSFLVKGSKVYAIGGSKHSDNKPCNFVSRKCTSESSPSELVYEFTLGDDDCVLRPSFKSCSSVPQLSMGMKCPPIVKLLGETYMLSDQLYHHTYFPGLPNVDSFWEKRFLVLSKDGMSWDPLPRPPPLLLDDKFRRYEPGFNGVFGSMLYVRVDSVMFGYNVKNKEWKKISRMDWFHIGSITLWSLPTEAAVVRQQSSPYVVISIPDMDKGLLIFASLVDEDGIASEVQVILEAKGRHDNWGSYKLIELESDKDSSTFALVFARDERIGLIVVRVHPLFPLLGKGVEEHVMKRPKLHVENEFLRVEVLVNQRYIIKGMGLPCTHSFIDDAFFY